jgi:hypothetical protein
MTSYQVWLKNTSGVRVAVFDEWQSLSYTKSLNTIGEAVLSINGDDTRKSLFTLDSQLEIYRRDPDGGSAISSWYLDWAGLVRYQQRSVDSSGLLMMTIRAKDYKELLTRRLIVPAAGSDFTAQNAVAGDTAAVYFVKQNIGDDASSRQITNFTGLTAAGTASNISYQSRYDNLYTVLRKLVGAATAAGTGFDFDVVGTGAVTWQFRTYVPILGTDRSATMTFSLEFGNLTTPLYSDDRMSEGTVAYVLGRGEGSSRTVTTVTATAAEDDSPFNRREVKASSQSSDATEATSVGETMLNKNRRVQSLTFQPVQTVGTRYGSEWTLGDKVTANFDGVEFVVQVTSVNITNSASGDETIKVGLRNFT